MGASRPPREVDYCRRPPERPLLQRLRYAVWNPEERTFLGRTARRWGVIGLIYLVMYICIIIFFSICMCGLISAMDQKVPYFQLADSLIGNNPGLGHRPVYEDTALIWFRRDDPASYQKYIDSIDQLLAPYMNKSLLVTGGANQLECGDVKPPRDMVCAFNVSQLGPCSRDNGYGYPAGKPCVIIKLNKLYNWHPEFYEELPGDLPADVRRLYVDDQWKQDVLMTCAGERPADEEGLGPLEYYPRPGISHVYFPYDNTPGYLSPLVAVQLTNVTLSRIVNIRCRGWARNIVYSQSLKQRLGSTHFEIMVD